MGHKRVQIDVINESTVLKDADVGPVVQALQTQVTRDLEPAWGIDADLHFVHKGKNPHPDHWWLVLLDDSDQAGALGYHELTTTGLPIGKVFAKTDLQYGLNWSITTSHELLEMLVDPWINEIAMDAFAQSLDRLYCKEVCDACEADHYGYPITVTVPHGGLPINVMVSDFVFPSWFQPSVKTGLPYDQMKHLDGPMPKLLDGGYIGYYDVAGRSGWQQLTAERLPPRHARIIKAGSRRDRRRTPRHLWEKSTPKDRSGP